MNVVDRLRDEGFLVSPKVVNKISDIDSFINFIKINQPGINFIDENVINSFNIFLKGGFKSNIKIINNFNQINESRDINNWLGYYNKRYDILSSSLSRRVEMRPVISINRVDHFSSNNSFGLIGLVNDFRETSNGNFVIELEDPSGTINVLVSKGSAAFGLVNELILDEVIGVNVRKNGRWLFVDQIIFPDIPMHEKKESGDDSYAVFLSDSHVGSVDFLEDSFQKVFDWINSGDVVSSKIKYLFIVGDLVDGVGVYPEQDKELAIKNIYKQYERVNDFLKQVPKSIKIVITPGNHDAVRLSQPQPPLINDFTKALNNDNITFVSNPSMVNIHAINGFSGFDILLYHGNSYDYYINNVPLLRSKGYDDAVGVMEFLLRKRHLAPTHGSTLVAPSIADDLMLINKVPDVFVSGHTHHSGIGSYKGVSLVNASCFQSQSSFQKRLGIKPQPGKVPIMSLNNGKFFIKDFMK